MNEQLLFEDEQLVIKYIGNGILSYKIIGFVNLGLVQKIDKELVSAMRTTKAQKIITDTSAMGVIAPNAEKYNNEIFIPNWHRLRIKYNAIILSSSIFGKLSAEKITEEYKKSKAQSGFTTKMFDTYEDALAWITDQK